MYRIVPTHSRPIYADIGGQVIDSREGVELNQWINGQTAPGEGMRVLSDFLGKNQHFKSFAYVVSNNHTVKWGMTKTPDLHRLYDHWMWNAVQSDKFKIHSIRAFTQPRGGEHFERYFKNEFVKQSPLLSHRREFNRRYAMSEDGSLPHQDPQEAGTWHHVREGEESTKGHIMRLFREAGDHWSRSRENRNMNRYNEFAGVNQAGIPVSWASTRVAGLPPGGYGAPINAAALNPAARQPGTRKRTGRQGLSSTKKTRQDLSSKKKTKQGSSSKEKDKQILRSSKRNTKRPRRITRSQTKATRSGKKRK